MRLFISFSTQLLLLLSPSMNGLRQAATSRSQAQSSAVGKLMKVSGTVTVSRKGLKKPITPSRNFQLLAADRVIVAAASSAKIFCFQGYQSFELPPGEHDVSCAAAAGNPFTEILAEGRGEVASIRGPNGAIVAPRANDYPAMLVKIINSRPSNWSTSISLKRLMPNETRSSLVNEIKALPISSDEKRLLLADVYSLNKLYDRAIEQLTGVTDAANDPFIQINLGDLYLASNFPTEAKRAYSSAIQAAAAAHDSLGEAIAQHALGMVYKIEGGHVSEAAGALTKAIELYTDLGETAIADLLQTELQGLQSSPPVKP